MKTEMTKEKMIKKSDEELLKKIIKGVKEKLNKNTPEDLDEILDGYVGLQGPYSKQFLINSGEFSEEIVEYFDENICQDEFLHTYLDWVTYKQHQIMENEEEIKSIKDEELKYELSRDWVESDGFSFIGFQNYIYYLTNEVIEEFTEDRIERYSEILEDNDFESSWEWVKDYSGGKNTSSIELLGKKYGEYSYDNIEYYISTNFQKELFETNPFGNDKDSPQFSFNNFKEFLLKLKELKLELDKKDNEIETEENEILSKVLGLSF